MNKKENTPTDLYEDLVVIIILASAVCAIIYVNNFYIGLLLIILAGLASLSYFNDFNTSTSRDKPSGIILLVYILLAIIGIIIMIFSDSSLGIFT